MGAGASSARIQKLQRQIAEEALLSKVSKLCGVALHVYIDKIIFQHADEDFLNDPEVVVELKQQVSSSSSFSSFSSQRRLEHICNDHDSVSIQVQGCLHHIRALNAKLASGCDPNSEDLKVV